MDSEALYTLVSGIKPFSGGFPDSQVDMANPNLKRVTEQRAILEIVRCGGEIGGGLHHYAKPTEGTAKSSPKRLTSIFFYNRSSMARMIESHQPFFAQYALSPNADPMEVQLTVEYIEGPDRLRGYGFLFGYPDYAVDFFVANTPLPQTRTNTPRKEGEPAAPTAIGKRKFMQIPAFVRKTGAFVYAVAPDHEENAEDVSLRERSTKILEQYTARREKYIGSNKPGIVALLRDWFCRSDTDCSASYAVAAQASAQAAQ